MSLTVAIDSARRPSKTFSGRHTWEIARCTGNTFHGCARSCGSWIRPRSEIRSCRRCTLKASPSSVPRCIPLSRYNRPFVSGKVKRLRFSDSPILGSARNFHDTILLPTVRSWHAARCPARRRPKNSRSRPGSPSLSWSVIESHDGNYYRRIARVESWNRGSLARISRAANETDVKRSAGCERAREMDQSVTILIT